ncbi:cyclic 2,3-diphosphoglycerate synthase [Salidesulfovibrio brasiliensis]
MARRIIIMGAAGRDFHNFNTLYRGRPDTKVVAFTATQINGISGRTYPPELAGTGYPDGIPIATESELPELIREHEADAVLFAYSDVTHEHVMHCASMVQAQGADFLLPAAKRTMLESRRPVIAVCAVRTGCGKSQTTREICRFLMDDGVRVGVVRHPMPYGDLAAQKVQRFDTHEDFVRHHCTIEEREEYEPLVDMGVTVWAGADYEVILREAESEADVILWDGGNNDTPFFRPDIHVTLLDPHRPGHELRYYPGETNLFMADVAVIAKTDTAGPEGIETVRRSIGSHAPDATVVMAASPVVLDDPKAVRGRRVLVVEDGPTLTHGEMTFGAGSVAARNAGAAERVDPRPHAAGSIKNVFAEYPHLGPVLPAMGYGKAQIADLEATINACECDAVVMGTPADLGRILNLQKPVVRATYAYADAGEPTLRDTVLDLLNRRCTGWRKTT